MAFELLPEKLAKECGAFRKNAKLLTDYICDTTKKVPELNIVPPFFQAGELLNQLPGKRFRFSSICSFSFNFSFSFFTEKAPEQPENFTKIIEDFDSLILPKVLHWKHPKFFAYFPGGNSLPNILGDMLSTALGGVGFSWVSKMCCLETPGSKGLQKCSQFSEILLEKICWVRRKEYFAKRVRRLENHDFLLAFECEFLFF